MRVRQAVVTLVLALAALTAVSAAFAGNGGIAPPDPATASASRISDLWWVLMGILIVIFVLVEGALVWFVFRYRRRGRADDAEGPQVHGHTKLELLWTAIPTAILIAVLVITIAMVPTVEAKPEAGTQPLVVDVTAHQFYWEYTYPNGVVAVDTLRLPEGRPVQLVLNAVDVIHSWWVPELQGKRDAIPGRTNTLNFTVARTGTFQGQCAELCGAQHALMPTTVEVVSATEFDGWLDDQAAAQSAGTSELGDETWDGVCAKCHGLDGSGGYGPEIAGNALLVDKQALAKLLAEGRDTPAVDGAMPVISTGWSDKQLQALIDYVSATHDLAPATGTGTGTETSAEGG